MDFPYFRLQTVRGHDVREGQPERFASEHRYASTTFEDLRNADGYVLFIEVHPAHGIGLNQMRLVVLLIIIDFSDSGTGRWLMRLYWNLPENH